ncbi:hypothetical protein LguiB_024886 [Lonicera macranthoides]
MLNLYASLSKATGLFSSQNPNKLCPLHHSHNSLFTTNTKFNPKTSSLSFTKTLPSKLILKSRQSGDYYDKSFSPNQPTKGLPPRVFVGHSIYKGKAALAVEPRPPEFSPIGPGTFKLVKEGCVSLQFAPAVAVRQYDWSRKQIFSLSVTELGTIMSLGSRDSCEFFHDPNKGRSDEGKVRKVLKVEPLPDGSGRFFNLSVQNKLINMDESIYIPITKGEYTILISAFNFIVPYLLGWHTFGNSINPEDGIRADNANSRAGTDYEWNR